jgi:cation diffusion facilitator family transporter
MASSDDSQAPAPTSAHGMESGGVRAIIAAFLANLGIAVAKFIAFVATGSASMLAESVHSLADTANQGLLMLGGRRARRPASEKHPFGHGTERYFWAFVVAVVLFTAGSAFAILEGIDKIRHPHEVESAGWAMAVLFVAILLESYSWRTAHHEIREVYPEGSLWHFVRATKAPELPVVLLEDSAALIGLFIAFGALGLTLATGDAVWDGYGTLGIGLLLGVVAFILAREMKSLLIGEAAAADVQASIRSAIETAPHVERLIHLRTMHLGPDELLVTAKVDLGDALSGQALASAIDEIERRIRAGTPTAQLIFVEPDVFRPDHAGADAPQDEAPAAH